MYWKFNKILISKYSPENECFCIDGELLIFSPIKQLKLNDYHKNYFTGILSGNKSKYGWSKIISDFTLKDFVEKNKLHNEPEDILLELLNSLSKHSKAHHLLLTIVKKIL